MFGWFTSKRKNMEDFPSLTLPKSNEDKALWLQISLRWLMHKIIIHNNTYQDGQRFCDNLHKFCSEI